MTSLPSVRHPVERGHELVGGVERQRRDARVALAGQGRVDAALGGEDDERALGRVADERAVPDLGVGAQRHRQEQRVERDVGLAADAGDLALGRVALAGDRVAPADDAIWTAVIWLSVSVPVLSELIADVEPSVSTERSRFTIAPAAASVVVPIDRIAVTTAGRPVGMADTENATAVRKSSSNGVSRHSPRPIEMASATPAMTRIWLVSALS